MMKFNCNSFRLTVVICAVLIIQIQAAVAGAITYEDAIYQSGDTLSSSDLNAKLNQIKGGVNDNDSRITSLESSGGSVSPKHLTINPFGGIFEGGVTTSTGFGANAGVLLPDTGTPRITYGFVIPTDYTPGDSVTLNFIVHTPSTSCGIVLAPNFTSVARAGQTHLLGAGASTGLAAVTSNTITAPSTASQSINQQYALTAPDGTSLQANDSFIFGLFRSSANANDTCTGNLHIQGIYITY